MDKIFVILGKAACGKTSLIGDLSKELTIEVVIGATSRPPRPGEIDGIHNHFKKKEDFKDEDFIEIKEFNGWMYGTPKGSIQDGKSYLIILEPEGYRNLKEQFGNRVVGIYIMAPTDERWERYNLRNENPTVEQFKEAIRRFEADNEDFKDFEFEAEHTIINNKEYRDLIYKAIDIISWEL